MSKWLTDTYKPYWLKKRYDNWSKMYKLGFRAAPDDLKNIRQRLAIAQLLTNKTFYLTQINSLKNNG